MLQAYSSVLPNRGGVDIDFNGALDCFLIYYRHIVKYCQTEVVLIDFNGALDCYLICYRHKVEYCQTEEV